MGGPGPSGQRHLQRPGRVHGAVVMPEAPAFGEVGHLLRPVDAGAADGAEAAIGGPTAATVRADARPLLGQGDQHGPFRPLLPAPLTREITREPAHEPSSPGCLRIVYRPARGAAGPYSAPDR